MLLKWKLTLVIAYRHGSCLFCNIGLYILTTQGEDKVRRVILNLCRIDVNVCVEAACLKQEFVFS